MSEQALDHELDKLSEDKEIEQYLKLELKDLAKIRSDITKTEEDLLCAQELLEDRIEYKEVLACKEELKAYAKIQETLEENIRSDAVMLSAFTNYEDRKPVSCVEVKEFTIVNITDERIAKIWAAQNAPDALSIKKAPFNKIAKVMNLDFVDKSTEYRAQVSSNLSEYLDEN